MDQNINVDIPTFTYFNLRLSTNLKYIALSICKLASSTDDYTTLFTNFNTTCQSIFNTLLSNVYGKNNLQLSVNDKNGKSCLINGADGITIDKINLVMTTDFRILYKFVGIVPTRCNLEVPIYTDNICMNVDYIKNGYFRSNSNISFMEWVYLDPTTLLNVCKQNYDPFYSNFINYKFSSSNKDGRFSLSPLMFDAAQYYSSVVVACSLRLVNTSYKGPCMTCSISSEYGGSGLSLDISFDNETGIFSYDDIHKLIKKNKISLTNFPPTFPIDIETIYNQMDKSKFSSNNVSPQLVWIPKNNGPATPYINWPAKSQLVMNTAFKYKVNQPVVTIFTNIGSSGKSQHNTQNNKSNDSTYSTIKTVSLGTDSLTYNMGFNYFSGGQNDGTATIYNNISNISDTLYSTSTYNLKNKIPPLNMSKSNKFITHTSVLPLDTSDIKNNYFVSGLKDPIYNQNSLSHITSSNIYDTNTNNISWFSSDNTDTEMQFISSELLIFVTDNTNVQLSDINNLSEDNYNMYFNPQYPGEDQRCNEAVEIACKIDNSNDICACYPSFIDKNINNVINNLSLANTDRWCISPLCSSNIAYKNNINKNNSYCTQVCNSSLNIENKPYSSTNIDHTQIFSNCTNANTLLNSQGTDCNNCKNDEFCSLSSSGKRVCTKKSSCSLPCKDNYSCVIGKDNKQKCFPISSTTKKCTSDAFCDSSESCDPNFNICLPTVSNPPWIPILIVLGTFMICVLFFVLYKKLIMKEPLDLLSKTNIKFYVLIFIITSISLIIYFTLIKRRENFDYSISHIMKNKISNVCINNKDCTKPNSSCLNNICSCLIGYNYPNCNSDNLNICNSLCYLPSSLCAGIYFYITQLNNTLYAFSNRAVFRFLNGKWYETERLSINSLQNSNISGFNPYFSTPTYYNDPSMFFLPNKLCHTYNNKMIMYIQSDSALVSEKNTSFLVSFSPQNISPEFNKLNNPNNNDIPSNWTLLQSYTQKGYLSLYNNDSACNNIISIVFNDNLYIFGGYNSQGSINTNIIQISLNNPSNIIEISLSQEISFMNFSTCLASVKNNIIYIIGVQEKGSTISSIYSFDINKIKNNTVTLDFITTCPDDLNDIPITPNNGNVLIFNTSENSIDYINFIYNGSIKKLSLTKTDQQTSIQFYDNFTVPTIASNVNNYIFPSPTIKSNNNNITIPWIVSYTILNDFLFVISGDGSIFKISDYTSSSPKLVPCLPVNFTSPPIYNKNPGVFTPIGFKWSNELGGFYQLPPTDNITTSCVSCTGNCQGDNNDTTTCYPAIYKTQDCYRDKATIDTTAFGINYAWAGNAVGPSWGGGSTNTPGGCKGHGDDSERCRMYAKTSVTDENIIKQLSNVSDSYPIFFCSNNKNDTPFTNNKGAISPTNPNWVKSQSTDPVNVSYFVRNTVDNDHDSDPIQTCRGSVNTSTYPYCTIPN